MVKRGGINFSVSHIPPKFCVLYFPNAVSQTKWSVDTKGTKQQHKYVN